MPRERINLMNPYDMMQDIQKLLTEAKLKPWKSFSEPPHVSIKRQSTSCAIIPGGFQSESPQESTGGRIGTFSFKVRLYVNQKSDIEGDAALKALLDTSLETLLDALCGYQGADPYFQGVVYLTSMSDPGKSFTDQEDFLRFLDCNFQVRLGV